MGKAKYLIIFLGFVIPYLLVYRSFFSGGALAWGDAPFFYPENLKELFNPPLTWNFKNDNFGAPQYTILWLYLPTYLYGVFNHFLGLGNNLLVRVIFYLPATILAIFGSWLFLGRITQSLLGKFLGVILYSFNTYFLILIDGGQVGVALAYGLFPLVIFSSLKYLKERGIKNYLLVLCPLFLLVNIDLRIAILAIFFLVLWESCQIFILHNWQDFFKKLRGLVIILLSVGLASSYWLIPFIFNFPLTNLNINQNSDQSRSLITLINSLFLFQPHFPLNEFGKILPTPFYFGFLPLLLLGNLIFLKKGDKTPLSFTLVFLIFAFLTKGSGEPFGEAYLFFVKRFPFGLAFRDSSKFFIPLMLSSAAMLSLTITTLENLGKKKFFWVASILIYFFLLFLIYPAILGNLTGTLGNSVPSNDFDKIYSFLKSNSGFYRTLWFEEVPPLGFKDWQRPAISANILHTDRPFASMINGQYDLFQFVRSPLIGKWWNLLGIKYVFVSGNERKKTLTKEDLENKAELLKFLDNNSGLVKLPLQTFFSAFEISDPKPQIFAQKKIFLVMGGEEIYQQLNRLSNFALANQGFVFLEDGQSNPGVLEKIQKSDAVLLFAGKSSLDLAMVSLQNKFLSPLSAFRSEWKIRGSNEYLNWKYDLLKGNITSLEFDFGKGMAFSTVPGEKIQFKLNVPQKDKYYLAARFTSKDGDGLKVILSTREEIISHQPQGRFNWSLVGPFDLEKGEMWVSIKNGASFAMLNTLALVSEKDFEAANQWAAGLISHFKTVQIDSEDDWQTLAPELEINSISLSSQQIDPTHYQINNLSKEARWLVFSDHFHLGWEIEEKKDSLHFPFYAMINGFYLKDTPSDVSLIFTPQKPIHTGIILSIVSVILFGLLFLIYSRLWRKKDE